MGDPMKNHDDDNTIEAARDLYRRDPRRGFDRLYAALADRLTTWLHRAFSLSSEEIADVVHDSFLPWVEHPERMKEVDNPRAYFFSTARNIAFKKRREPATAVLEPETTVVSDLGNPAQREAALDVESALSRLPEEQRETVALKIWGDLTFEEIADVQGVSINTAAARYRYALQKLKESLA